MDPGSFCNDVQIMSDQTEEFFLPDRVTLLAE